MSQVTCHFHPSTPITNFCRNSQCLLPMCPSCIKIHSAQHLKLNTHGNYDCMKDVEREVYTTLQNTMSLLVQISDQLKVVMQGKEKERVGFIKILGDMRKSIIISVNKFIDGIEQEIITQVNQLQNYTVEQFAQLDNKIQKLSTQAQTQLQGLSSQKLLKSIIRHISSNMPSYYSYKIHQISQKAFEFKSCPIYLQSSTQLKIQQQLSSYLKMLGQIYQENFMEPIKRQLTKKCTINSSKNEKDLSNSRISKGFSVKDVSTNGSNSNKKILC